MYQAFKHDGGSDFSLDDPPLLWWIWWKNMHDEVLGGRFPRMRDQLRRVSPGLSEALDLQHELNAIRELMGSTQSERMPQAGEGEGEGEGSAKGSALIKDLIANNVALHYKVRTRPAHPPQPSPHTCRCYTPPTPCLLSLAQQQQQHQTKGCES